MDESFWHSKWELGHTAFHEQQANALLVKHLDKLELSPNNDIDKAARLFLPLCGKTLDIAYLMNLGYQVVGVEFSELAIEELFQQLAIKPTISKANNLTHYQAQGIDIYVGDFFDLDAIVLGKVDAIYDRAALVALPEDLRQRYSKHLYQISNSAPQLLICFEYDQQHLEGPPFAVLAKMVKEYYADTYALDCLESIEVNGGLKKKVVAKEVAWLLTPLKT